MNALHSQERDDKNRSRGYKPRANKASPKCKIPDPNSMTHHQLRSAVMLHGDDNSDSIKALLARTTDQGLKAAVAKIVARIAVPSEEHPLGAFVDPNINHHIEMLTSVENVTDNVVAFVQAARRGGVLDKPGLDMQPFLTLQSPAPSPAPSIPPPPTKDPSLNPCSYAQALLRGNTQDIQCAQAPSPSPRQVAQQMNSPMSSFAYGARDLSHHTGGVSTHRPSPSPPYRASTHLPGQAPVVSTHTPDHAQLHHGCDVLPDGRTHHAGPQHPAPVLSNSPPPQYDQLDSHSGSVSGLGSRSMSQDMPQSAARTPLKQSPSFNLPSPAPSLPHEHKTSVSQAMGNGQSGRAVMSRVDRIAQARARAMVSSSQLPVPTTSDFSISGPRIDLMPVPVKAMLEAQIKGQRNMEGLQVASMNNPFKDVFIYTLRGEVDTNFGDVYEAGKVLPAQVVATPDQSRRPIPKAPYNQELTRDPSYVSTDRPHLGEVCNYGPHNDDQGEPPMYSLALWPHQNSANNVQVMTIRDRTNPGFQPQALQLAGVQKWLTDPSSDFTMQRIPFVGTYPLLINWDQASVPAQWVQKNNSRASTRQFMGSRGLLDSSAVSKSAHDEFAEPILLDFAFMLNSAVPRAVLSRAANIPPEILDYHDKGQIERFIVSLASCPDRMSGALVDNEIPDTIHIVNDIIPYFITDENKPYVPGEYAPVTPTHLGCARQLARSLNKPWMSIGLFPTLGQPDLNKDLSRNKMWFGCSAVHRKETSVGPQGSHTLLSVPLPSGSLIIAGESRHVEADLVVSLVAPDWLAPFVEPSPRWNHIDQAIREGNVSGKSYRSFDLIDPPCDGSHNFTQQPADNLQQQQTHLSASQSTTQRPMLSSTQPQPLTPQQSLSPNVAPGTGMISPNCAAVSVLPSPETQDPELAEWVGQFLPHELAAMLDSRTYFNEFPVGTKSMVQERFGTFRSSSISFWSDYVFTLSVEDMMSIRSNSIHYPNEAIDCVKQALLGVHSSLQPPTEANLSFGPATAAQQAKEPVCQDKPVLRIPVCPPSGPQAGPSILPSQQDHSPSKSKGNAGPLRRSTTLQGPPETPTEVPEADLSTDGSMGQFTQSEGTLSSSSGTQHGVDSASREMAVAHILGQIQNRDLPHSIMLRRACTVAAFMERRAIEQADLDMHPAIGGSVRIDELDSEIAHRLRWIDNRIDSPYPGDDEHVFSQWNLVELDAFLALFPAALDLIGKPASSANPSPATKQADVALLHINEERARTKASTGVARGRKSNVMFIKRFTGADPEQVLKRSNAALVGMSTSEKLRELITHVNAHPEKVTEIIDDPEAYHDDLLDFIVAGLTGDDSHVNSAQEAVTIPAFSGQLLMPDDPPPAEWIERFLPHQLAAMNASTEPCSESTRTMIQQRLEQFAHAPGCFWSDFISQLSADDMDSVCNNDDYYPPAVINCIRQARVKLGSNTVQPIRAQPQGCIPPAITPRSEEAEQPAPVAAVVHSLTPQELQRSVRDTLRPPSVALMTMSRAATPPQAATDDESSCQANQVGSALLQVLGVSFDEGPVPGVGWTEVERAQERLRIYNQVQKHNHLKVMPPLRTPEAVITHGDEAYRRLLKLSVNQPESPWSPLVAEGAIKESDMAQKPPLMKVVELRLRQLQSTRRNLDSAEWGDKTRLQDEHMHNQTCYLEALHDYQNGRASRAQPALHSARQRQQLKERSKVSAASQPSMALPVDLLELLPHQLGNACAHQPDMAGSLDQATEILEVWRQSVDSPRGKLDWVKSLKHDQVTKVYESHKNGGVFYHNDILNLAAARLSLAATAEAVEQPPVSERRSVRRVAADADPHFDTGSERKRGKTDKPKSKGIKNPPKRSRSVSFADQHQNEESRRSDRTSHSLSLSLKHPMQRSILPSTALPLLSPAPLCTDTDSSTPAALSHPNPTPSHNPPISTHQSSKEQRHALQCKQSQPSRQSPVCQWHLSHFSRHNNNLEDELDSAQYQSSILPSSTCHQSLNTAADAAADIDATAPHSLNNTSSPTIPCRAHVRTHSARHAELEEELYALWDSTIDVSSQEKTYDFHLDHLIPIFEALGLLEGSVRLGWIDELQEFRRITKVENQWNNAAADVAGHQLALLPYLGDFAIVSTDGSSKDAGPIRNNAQLNRSASRTARSRGKRGRQNRPVQASGSGAVFHADPLRPIAFRSATKRQDNDVGEIDAATASRHRACSQLAVLMLTDAQRVRTLINITLPTWKLLPPSTRIAKHVSAIVLFVLIQLAAGPTQALKFPAHALELSFNQVADQLANTGTTKTRTDSKLIKRLIFSNAIMFIRTFGESHTAPQFQNIINPLSTTPMFSQRDPRWTPSLRFTIGSSPVKEESVRVIMGPILSGACSDLIALRERAEQCPSPSELSAEVADIRKSFQEITERMDSAIWEVVVSHFGLRVSEASPHSQNNPNSSRFHSAEFNSKVAELSELNTAVENAEQTIHSVQGINLPGVDQSELSSFADHAEFQLALTTICKVLVHSRPDCLSDACKLIEMAGAYAHSTGQELDAGAAADREAHSMSRGFGLWRNKQLRQYFRHVINRSICRKPKFDVDPCVYLDSLTNKVLPACFPTATGIYEASLTSISAISLMNLNAPRSVAEMEALLMKAREQSAPSPLRQISYKMWQMLLPQHYRNLIRSARKVLVQKWKEDTAILDEGEVDDFMYWEAIDQEGTDLLSDSEDEEMEAQEVVEGTPSGINMSSDKSVAVYILTIVQLVELIAWIPPDFTQFCVRPLFKPKPSAYVGLSDADFDDLCKQVSKFREVMLANSCIRKLVGGVVSRRGLDFIETNRINLGIQVGYIPGFDPSRLNHCRTNICRFWTSMHPGASEVLVLYDWVSFFSFLTPKNMAKAYSFLELPYWMINTLNALGAPKDIFYTSGGRIHGPSSMKCDAQGCPESCFNAIAVSCAFCARLDAIDAGFSLPDFSSRAPKVNAMMQVDDLKVLVGGADKSAQQVADEAFLISQEVISFQQEFGFMAQVDVNPLKSKTVAAVRMRTDLGQQARITCTLNTLTKDGSCPIPFMLDNQAHSDLGVMVHSEHQRTAEATYSKALSVIQERASLHLQSDLPSQGRLYSLWVSVLGGTKWLSNMGQYIPYDLSEQLTSNCIDMVKRILALGACSSTALIFVPKLQFGIGFPHFTQSIMTRALVNVIADKSSRSTDMIQWSWYELEFAREVNGIPQVAMHSGGFFDWDTSLLTSKSVLSMPFQCGHTWACAACIDAGLRTVGIESIAGPCIAVVPCSDLSSLHRTTGTASDTSNCVSGKSRINKLIKRSFSNHWLQKASGQMALRFFQDRRAFHSALSNAWRSDSTLRDSAFKWCIKACSGQLVTPAVVCSRWGAIESPACPMPNCSWNWCDDKHILQRCAWNKSKITLRHDKCKVPFLDYINNSCTHWRYIGEPDCAPPAHLIQASWKEDLAALLPEREHLPFRADVILADDLVYSKLRVRIVDFKIAWDSNMVDDGDAKVDKYQPVADMITRFCTQQYGYVPDVRVVPIVIGACGSIPADWYERLADLEATEAGAAKLAKTLSTTIIEESANIFYGWTGDARAHGF